MTMTDHLATEFQIKALRNALRSAKNEADSVRNEPFRPWRDDGGEFQDRVRAAKEAVYEIESQIIDLEQSLRDPEQYAEMRAEIEAAIWISGNTSDRADWYLHTPMEEERFQEQIQHDIEYGYFDEDGGWNDGLYHNAPHHGECSFCHGSVWDDEGFWMNGDFGCEDCYADIKGFAIVMCLLSQLIGVVPFFVREDSKWGDADWSIATVSGESEEFDS